MGLKYGSDEATNFSETVHKAMALSAYRSSIDMAKDRGKFSVYDSKLDHNSDFIKRVVKADPDLGKDMKKYGRRNISLLTIAPTGSTSLMTQTTSGIEPVFMPVYKRRRKINPQEEGVTVDFTDEVGDSWTEYNVFHHKFIEWYKIFEQEQIQLFRDSSAEIDIKEESLEKMTSEQLDIIIKLSPYHEATSNDINWLAKVRMQGQVQKWVDHSISVTVNVPSNVNKDLIGDIYQTAHKEGCKGITVYREGSRSGVLISGKKILFIYSRE